jgi:hypothetical protein
VAEPCRAHGGEPVAHARLAAIDGSGHFDGAVVGEHVDHVIPHLAVDVIAERGLEVADGVLVVEPPNAGREPGERGLGCRRLALGRDDRHSGLVGGEVVGHDRQVAAAPVRPAGLVGARILREVACAGDAPGAVVGHAVVVDEDPAFDRRLAAAAEEHQHRPAAGRRAAAGGEADHRRLDHHQPGIAGLEPVVPAAVAGAQERGDLRRTAHRLALADLAVEGERRIGREQRADLAPQAVLRVLRVVPLQVLDRAQALDPPDVAREFGDRAVRRWSGLRRTGHRHQRRDRGKEAQRRRSEPRTRPAGARRAAAPGAHKLAL